METNIIFPILVAIIAIIPGVWALVNQGNKEKTQTNTDMKMVEAEQRSSIQFENLRDEIAYTKYSIKDRINSNIIYGDIVDKLWEKMYEIPSIIRCVHCDSPNVITNLNCTQCGAPLK
jgi:hypothetical protein